MVKLIIVDAKDERLAKVQYTGWLSVIERLIPYYIVEVTIQFMGVSFDSSVV